MLLNNEIVEVMDSYTYLGLLFNYNGNFCQGRKKVVDQPQKALYALYRKNYNLAIPVDLQLKLFDYLVIHLSFYILQKYGVLNVYLILRKFTCNFAKSFIS